MHNSKVAKECQTQLRLRDQLEAEGLSLMEDPFLLSEKIGTVQTLPVRFDGQTPKGLYRFYIENEPNAKAFHLVSPNLFLEEDKGKMGLVTRETYMLQFVIGVRRVGNIGYVISLRLPR